MAFLTLLLACTGCESTPPDTRIEDSPVTDSSVDDSTLPDPPGGVFMSSEGGWLDVDIGYGMACGIDSESELVCWGCVPADDTGWNGVEMCNPPRGKFTSVDCGDNVCCAIDLDRQATCWRHAQRSARPAEQVSVDAATACTLSEGVADCNSFAMHKVDPLQQVDASAGRVCGVTTSGHGICIDLGMPSEPELEAGEVRELHVGSGLWCALHHDGSVVCEDGVSPEGRFTQLDISYRDRCGLLESGSVLCWGRDSYHGPPREGVYTKVSTYMAEQCALDTEGFIECWGIYNAYGELEVP
jgi:hypothetical protein